MGLGRVRFGTWEDVWLRASPLKCLCLRLYRVVLARGWEGGFISKERERVMRKVASASILWSLWRERNGMVFSNNLSFEEEVF